MKESKGFIESIITFTLGLCFMCLQVFVAVKILQYIGVL